MGHKGLKMQVMDCCKVLGTNQETYGIEDVGYIDLCKVLGISQETYGTEDAGWITATCQGPIRRHVGLKMQIMDCCKVLGTNWERYGTKDAGYVFMDGKLEFW